MSDNNENFPDWVENTLEGRYLKTSLPERHMLLRKGWTVQPVHVLLKCFADTLCQTSALKALVAYLQDTFHARCTCARC